MSAIVIIGVALVRTAGRHHPHDGCWARSARSMTGRSVTLSILASQPDQPAGHPRPALRTFLALPFQVSDADYARLLEHVKEKRPAVSKYTIWTRA